MNVETRAETLYRLAGVAHEVATSHGFDAPTWENFPGKLMLVVSELSELAEACAESSCPLDLTGTRKSMDELADVVIRTMTILHGLFGSWNARGSAFDWIETHSSIRTRLPDSWVVVLLRSLSLALEAWRRDDRATALYHCERLLHFAFQLADAGPGVDRHDLLACIEEKIAKNATRPALHSKIMTLG